MLLSPGKEKAHPKQRRMAKSQITSSLGRSCPGPDHSHEDKSNTEQHWDANASCVHLTSFHVPVVLTYEGWTARILERVCRREPIFPLLCVCRRVAASSLRSIMDLLCLYSENAILRCQEQVCTGGSTLLVCTDKDGSKQEKPEPFARNV